MRKRFLRLFVALTLRHPMIIIVVLGILTISSIAAIMYLDIETDVTTLLPADSPVSRTLDEALKTFKSFDYTFVVLEASEPEQGDLLIRAAEKLAPALENPAFIYDVSYKLDPRLKDFYLDKEEERISCLLGEKDLESALARFEPATLHRYVVRLARRLQVVTSPETKRRLLEDPLELAELFSRRLMVSQGLTPFPLRKGHFLSEDEKVLLMVLRPLEPSSDLKFSTQLISFLNRAKEAMIEGDSNYQGKVIVTFLGSHAEAVANTRMVRRDLFQTLIASFIGVLVLFLFVFRRKEAIIFVGLPLFVAILWTLGLTQLVLGRLTVVTFAIGAVLIGLGIDFAIHIYNRFLEERRRSDTRSIQRDLQTALVKTGEGVLLGALTTAAAFYAMAFTSFRGFRELGFVAGSGILCCFASIFLLLPLLIRYVSPGASPRKGAGMTSFGLPRLYQMVSEYPRLFIILALVITVYFAFQASFVRFDEQFGALKQPSRSYAELWQRLQKRFPLPSHQIIAIVSASTLQGVLEKNDRLFENMENQDIYPILSCDTLRAFLPSIQTQKRSKRLIMDTIGKEFEVLKQRLINQAARVGLSPEAVGPFLDRLSGLRAAARKDDYFIRYKHLRNPFVIQLVQHYLVKQDFYVTRSRQYKVVTRIFPPAGQQWVARVPRAFLNTLSRGIGRVDFTGVAIVADEIQNLVKQDLARMMLLVIGAVFVILVLYFGRLHKTLFAILPVVCGCIWMLGTIRILGIRLNFLNVVVIPMIIGVGVDNGIHLMQRYYEGTDRPGGENLKQAVEMTGRALVMTSLTTIVGFGSLALADFRGIREMGLLSIFGIAYILFASIILLPALLHIWGRRRRLSDLIGREDGEIR